MGNVIEIENLSKYYDLGQVGTGTLFKDINRAWARMLGKPDPYALIAELNDRTIKSKSNTIYALKDINFTVNKGEIVGIIGKNGAGKSTLLKILSEITSPSTGEIRMKGRVASLLEVGTGMHPEMTAKQNIYLNGSLMGMSKNEIKAKFDEIIDFAGILKYVNTPIKRFSSGMKVRLGFAIAAFLEPEILIVDEVLAVGDAEFQRKAVGKMKKVSDGDGRTVLFVSHNMTSIQHLCSRTIVLSNGLTVFDGPVEEGINFYTNQNKLLSENSLSERTDRINSRNFKFTDIKLFNSSKKFSFEFISGEDIEIEICYSLKERLIPVAVRLLVMDSNGSTRFLLNSGVINKTPESLAPSRGGHIYCSVPNLPLPKGTYNIQASLFSISGIEDDVEFAATFDVVGGDFYKTGKVANLSEGVLINYNFDFKSD